MRPAYLLPFLVPALAAGCSPAPPAPEESPRAFLETLVGELREAARPHRQLLDSEEPMMPTDEALDPLVADLRRVLEPALLPGVIEDWDELITRLGLTNLCFQLCPEGEVIYGAPRPFGDAEQAPGARIRIEYPSAGDDPVRQDLVMLATNGAWKLCRRPIDADRPEQEVALYLEMGLLPCAEDAPAALRQRIDSLAGAGAELEVLAASERGPALRLELRARVEGSPEARFTAVHERQGWVAHP